MPVRLRPPNAAVVLFALACLALTMIVHLVTILAIPSRAANDAFDRVARLVPLAAKTLLPTPASGQDDLPFRDPAMATAICRYDLRTGPLRLSIAPIDRGFLSFGFHTRQGIAFYGLTVRQADATALDIVVVTEAQKVAMDSKQNEDEQPAQAVLVVSPAPEGFVTVEAPLDGGENLATIEDRFAALRCAIDVTARR